MIKKMIPLLGVSVILSGCILAPKTGSPITGNQQQQSEKLAAIMAKGGAATCKITNLDDNTVTEIAVKGKKMRLSGSQVGEAKKGIMINDEKYLYTWSEGEKVGVKLPIVVPTPEKTGETAETLDNNQADAAKYEDESKYKMDCVAGGVNDSVFIPPAEVVFTDYSSMIPSIAIPVKE